MVLEANYWKKRALLREKLAFDNSIKLNKKLKIYYNKSLSKINKEIESFYSRYAKENNITLQEARKRMSRKEYQEWKYSIEEYVDMLETKPILDALSYNSQISRLKALETSIKLELSKLSNVSTELITEHLTDTYLNGFYRSIFDIQQGIGFTTMFGKVDDKMVQEVLSYPWSGIQYSERIWNNSQRLGITLQETLTNGIIKGDNIGVMTKNIKDKFNTSYYNSERLVRTETGHFHEEATHSSYVESNVEKYQILATLDTRTSKICREQDGKVYNMKDREEGVNAPLYHVNCRTTTIIYDSEEELSERIAEGNIKVPSDMTYDEWYKKYVQT
jgi:SPP1 gp7 family putative phage head morphogenesis protein